MFKSSLTNYWFPFGLNHLHCCHLKHNELRTVNRWVGRYANAKDIEHYNCEIKRSSRQLIDLGNLIKLSN